MPIDNADQSRHQRTSSDSFRPFDACGPDVTTKTEVTHEPIWTVAEVAAILRVSNDTVIRRLRSEDGVLLISGPSGRYQTLRIPDRVLKRVLQKLTVRNSAVITTDAGRRS